MSAPQDGDDRVQSVGHFEHVVQPGLQELQILSGGRTLHAHLERNCPVVGERAKWSGDALNERYSRYAEYVLGDSVQDEQVDRIPQIMIGFHHEKVWIQPGRGEVTLGGGVSQIGGK